MESWLSGRRRTTGNRVYVNSVTRVQIPNSPPHPEVFVYKASGFFDASGKTTVLSGKKANREIRF